MAKRRLVRTIRCPHCRRLADRPKGSPDCGRPDCRDATLDAQKRSRAQAGLFNGMRKAMSVAASAEVVNETPGTARGPEQPPQT